MEHISWNRIRRRSVVASSSSTRATAAVLVAACICIAPVVGLRRRYELDQCLAIRGHKTIPTLAECYLIPSYAENYYYTTLREKFDEVMSVNNCSMAFGRDKSDLDVSIVPPPAAVTRRWGTLRREHYNVSRPVTFRTNRRLCFSKDFLIFKRGRALRSKGCDQLIRYDRLGRRHKIIKRGGATLHPMHIRCVSACLCLGAQSTTQSTTHNRARCKRSPPSRCQAERSSKACVEASQRAVPLEPDLRSFHEYPFLITARRAVVSRGGQMALPCGYVGLLASCEAWGWGLMNVTASIPRAAPQLCRDSDDTGGGPTRENNCPFPMHDRVFVVTSYDDTQIGQFIQEALPKLVYHLDFIRANPDIKLHYGFSKLLDQLPKFVLPHLVFQWLGLSDRLINGTVYAKTVYMPREGGCQDVSYNAWEFLTTREVFLTQAGVDQDSNSRQRSIVVIRRSASPYTKNQGDYRQRRWPKKELELMLEQLKVLFPQHRVDVYSDIDRDLMSCRDCQIKMFADADVVIAAHGAGLTNTMFMRPGGIVIEVVSRFDSRHVPVVGIFPRLSAVIGLHHYTYYLKAMKDLQALVLLKVRYMLCYVMGRPAWITHTGHI